MRINPLKLIEISWRASENSFSSAEPRESFSNFCFEMLVSTQLPLKSQIKTFLINYIQNIKRTQCSSALLVWGCDGNIVTHNLSADQKWVYKFFFCFALGTNLSQSLSNLNIFIKSRSFWVRLYFDMFKSFHQHHF